MGEFDSNQDEPEGFLEEVEEDSVRVSLIDENMEKNYTNELPQRVNQSKEAVAQRMTADGGIPVDGVVDVEGHSTLKKKKQDDLEDIIVEEEKQNTARNDDDMRSRAAEAKKFVDDCAPDERLVQAFLRREPDAIDELRAAAPGRLDKALPDRLRADSRPWQHVGRPVRRLVLQGLTRVLHRRPPPNRCSPYRLNAESQESLDVQLEEMKELGVIADVEESQCMNMHNVFVVKQSDENNLSKFRVVADLRNLNDFSKKARFQLQGLKELRNLVFRGAWMSKCDLSKAYWHVPLGESLSRHFCFPVQTSQGIKFCRWLALPFGFSLAPFLFSLMMRSTLRLLRVHTNIIVIDYLDDFLVLSRSFAKGVNDWLTLIFFLTKFGFSINYSKCSQPAQIQRFLGMIIDSCGMKFSIPRERVIAVRKTIRRLLKREHASPRELARLLGEINWCAMTIPYLRSLTVCCNKMKRDCLRFDARWDTISPLTLSVIKELNTLHIYLQNCELGTNLRFAFENVDFVLECDASDSGYGSVLRKGTAVIAELSEFWTPVEKLFHINQKELLAIKHSLYQFIPFISQKTTLVRCDNVSAVSCVRRLYNLRSPILHQISTEIRSLAMQHKLSLCASHLSGVHNVRADILSRREYDNADWSLDSHIFRDIVRLCQAIGIEMSHDLFSTYKNKKLERFVSRYYHRDASFVDAFSQSWANLPCPFINPPFILFSKVLTKILEDSCRLSVCIIPVWPSRPWWNVLRSMTCIGLQINRRRPLYTPFSGVYCPAPRWGTVVLILSPHKDVQQLVRNRAQQIWPNILRSLVGNEAPKKHILPSFENSMHFAPGLDWLTGLPILR